MAVLLKFDNNLSDRPTLGSLLKCEEPFQPVAESRKKFVLVIIIIIIY
jgi:hypothetical protein